jgi:hypothetical protein
VSDNVDNGGEVYDDDAFDAAFESNFGDQAAPEPEAEAEEPATEGVEAQADVEEEGQPVEEAVAEDESDPAEADNSSVIRFKANGQDREVDLTNKDDVDRAIRLMQSGYSAQSLWEQTAQAKRALDAEVQKNETLKQQMDEIIGRYDNPRQSTIEEELYGDDPTEKRLAQMERQLQEAANAAKAAEQRAQDLALESKTREVMSELDTVVRDNPILNNDEERLYILQMGKNLRERGVEVSLADVASQRASYLNDLIQRSAPPAPAAPPARKPVQVVSKGKSAGKPTTKKEIDYLNEDEFDEAVFEYLEANG